MNLPFHIPTDHLAKFCHQHHIKRLSLFGSVLREDFRPDSDIDVLVELQPGAKFGQMIGWNMNG